ncbi:hypothetical protein ACJQWK_10165 [Exserohilum turcicum]
MTLSHQEMLAQAISAHPSGMDPSNIWPCRPRAAQAKALAPGDWYIGRHVHSVRTLSDEVNLAKMQKDCHDVHVALHRHCHGNRHCTMAHFVWERDFPPATNLTD